MSVLQPTPCPRHFAVPCGSRSSFPQLWEICIRHAAMVSCMFMSRNEQRKHWKHSGGFKFRTCQPWKACAKKFGIEAELESMGALSDSISHTQLQTAPNRAACSAFMNYAALMLNSLQRLLAFSRPRFDSPKNSPTLPKRWQELEKLWKIRNPLWLKQELSVLPPSSIQTQSNLQALSFSVLVHKTELLIE